MENSAVPYDSKTGVIMPSGKILWERTLTLGKHDTEALNSPFIEVSNQDTAFFRAL